MPPIMKQPVTRRHLLAAGAATLPLAVSSAAFAAPLPASAGRSVGEFGVRANTDADQSPALQRAFDAAARDNAPLWLPPGRYRGAALRVPSGLYLTGQPGASLLELAQPGPLLDLTDARGVTLDGVTFDGRALALPPQTGLVHGTRCDALRILDCTLRGSGGESIWLAETSGDIRHCDFADGARSAIAARNGRGLLVAQNTIRGMRENGIEILLPHANDVGTLVVDNRIERIAAGPGGSGQYGNAIVVYRAANVIVRGNIIRDCDYSGVRGNSANAIQILGNTIHQVREVAIYSEFSFEGAIIANNSVDGAAFGISVCNFNEGGRLATVTGNLVRNILPARPAGSSDSSGGIGIYVEADASVTGNVVEKAPFVGIMAGWGKYLRDVAITGNVVRDAFIGIGVSSLPGAGKTLVTGNIIAGAARGAIVGMDHDKAMTPDLAQPGAVTPANLTVANNSAH